MAPSPAAGKQQAAPKTPTKLTRKPQNTPQKLGQSAQSTGGKGTPSTPKAASAKKPETSTPSQPKKPDTGKAQQTAQGAADNAKQQAGDTAEQAQSSAGGDDDEGPMSKVSETGEQAKEGLEEAAPEPINDDDDDNAVEGAQQQAQDTAEEAGDDAEDVADDATEKAGQTVESADDATDDQQQDDQDQEQQQGEEQQGGLLKGAQGLAGKASGLAGKASQDPSGAAQEAGDDAKQGAEETAEGAEETADEGLDEAQKVAGEGTDEAEDATDGAEDQAEGAVEGATDGVEGAAEDAQDQAEGAAEGAQDQAEGAAEGAEETADGVTQEEPQPPEGLPLDLSILKGLEVQDDGGVVDSEGNPVGKLAEGDAEDLAGYPIGDEGEILDEDGDLVGRVELLPDQVKKQIEEAREQGQELPEGVDEYLDQVSQFAGGPEEGEEEDEEAGPQLPGLDIMEGLTCQVDGIIYDSEGNTIGVVTDGDPSELQNATLNDQGEFIDDDGNVVGHADIHDDAADLVEQGVYPAAGAAEEAAEEGVEGAEDQVDGVTDEADALGDEAEGAAEEGAEAAEGEAEGIEDELPGIEALEGKELNDAGEVVDEGGNILASIQDEELKRKIEEGEIDPDTLQINDEGQVVDEEGNVLETLDLADGAAERLAGGPVLDMRILDGKKINKKGKILDEDGEEIGELRDGELSECAGKKANDKGEVLDKQGNIIGHVNVVRGEAAENATKELLEELGETQPEEEQAAIPDLTKLDGLKVNKKGMILDEDGEPIGQLIDGDVSECAGKKVNDQGDVLDKDGNVIGRVTTLGEDGEPEMPQEEGEEEGQEEAEGEAEEEEEETGPELPPLSILEGLSVNKAGKLIDANGTIVGELVEGDAKKLSKSGITSDAEGQFWDNKGHVIGRAQTLPQEEPEEEAIFAGLEGLHVVEDGFVQDENGYNVGYVTEGDAKKLIGREVDEDGDIIDKKGSVVGHAERYEPEEEEPEPEEEPVDLSSLQGKTVNKSGLVIGDEGVPVARLVEGRVKELSGKELDDQGQIWNDKGKVIGRVEMIPEEERESKPEGPFAGLEGLRVIDGGRIADEDGNEVGEIVEGNPKRLVGLSVDEDGDILDKYGNVKGHAEPLPEEEEEVIDNSILAGKTLNKQGYVVDENGVPFGRLVEGDAKELAGRQCDEQGLIYNDVGKAVGRCEVIPENERVSRPEGPFAGLEGLRVVKDGWVEDEDGNRVGVIEEGNAKKLVGMAVDEDGDILDKYGNVKGHAEYYEEPEEEEVDLSALAGTRINKNGNAVDFSGQIVGRVVEGEVKSMIGKKVDGQGQIWDDNGNVVGRCELVYGEDTSPEGPFAGFEGLQINKDGTISTPGGDIIGRIIEGDIQKLLGHTVDEDGDIVDKNGNSIGKAERWEPEEKERRVSPMSGKRVNKEGEVRDEQGDIMGKLTSGDLVHCVGQEVDDAGNVVDVDGNKIGEVTLIENIVEEEYEGPTEEELEEARKREEEREIAEKMGGICTQTLERMQPICKQISDHMEKADRTPKEELDEEELVNNVKPLIEEAGRVLQECNGSLRGLDPDGRIAAQAKGRAGTGEATPEEYRLAETLKELTTTVVKTVDDAKKKLNDMPHAKKKLNPLWGLMTQPLFQILAAVGLLLAGVLGLVGQLLNGLGLGGLVNGLMGGLGINKLLESFGIGGGGSKEKKKGGGGGLSSLPIVGGFLGGDKK
ncbi:uncharacterized protein LTR77_003951 [Saxophila tyrrhenica]|uniref:DUF6987 domain-containing protein n=1 Tax=Saxophila tyrrhenica TaxID=1690608 RepID=A0AAV9PF18_9PEZI|nr:hypothetical protein LTR77_003951 [Saxophila tyrrhenica]